MLGFLMLGFGGLEGRWSLSLCFLALEPGSVGNRSCQPKKRERGRERVGEGDVEGEGEGKREKVREACSRIISPFDDVESC